MNKKLSHLVIFFFDLLCIGVLVLGYFSITQTLTGINNQNDVLRFGSRDGFYIVGIGLPVLHLLISVEHFWPNLIYKYKKIINQSIFIFVILLLGVGFIGSSWIKSQAENAGYVYCRNASGVSALARALVYTKNMKICDELSTSKRNHE